MTRLVEQVVETGEGAVSPPSKPAPFFLFQSLTSSFFFFFYFSLNLKTHTLLDKTDTVQ